jgi:cell division protease FtsH
MSKSIKSDILNKTNLKKLPRKKSKRFGLNFNTLSLMLGLFVLFSIVLNFLNSQVDAKEVSLSEFVDNIKNNKYSIVSIRDDGQTTAEGKYIYITNETPSTELREYNSEKVDIKDSSNQEIIDIDREKLFQLITPVSFKELIKSTASGRGVESIETIYVAENFILLENADKEGTDYIFKTTEDFNLTQELSREGIEEGKIIAEINDLMIASTEKSKDQLLSDLEKDQISDVWIIDGVTYARITNDALLREYISWSGITDDFSKFLQDEGIKFDEGTTDFRSIVVTNVPWGDIITIGILLGFGLLGLMMFRGIQGSGSQLMKFGKTKARMIFGSKPDVTFKDVAGVDEAREELSEVVLFLKEPKRFLDRGARIPKGLLMVGAPGTGKTLLARAIAGEAGVPFFHTSGSEFEEMLVGAGASRVRDLFEKAKKSAPSIIFIDEIDAVARKRGTTIQSGTTEQTLNQILVEMDGFERNTNVIVIAATNRPDVLDAAILRPGRFDRRVVLDLPDIEGRKQIIAIHAKNKPIAKSVDIELVAKRTVGFSGADLENMLNEAAIIVAKENRDEITFDDIEEASNKVQMGPAKKRKRDEKELRMTAYHEAGHALVMKLMPEHDPVHRVTIVSRGMALGYTMPLAEKDQVQLTKTKMLSNITALVAGFVTEELVFGDVTSGASNDIEKATDIAKKMVKNFGMSKKLGLVKYGQEENLAYLGHSYGEDRDYSEATSEVIDTEVREIVDNCYAQAKKIITENRKRLDNIVDSLMEKEVLDAEEFNAFFKD